MKDLQGAKPAKSPELLQFADPQSFYEAVEGA